MSYAGVDRPDSARSWVIAGAAFVINILLSGISRTTGLFYVSLIDTYGVSRMEANMPFTTRNIVRNLLGPVVGAIGHRYGAREVTIAGGLFASAGVALCAIAPNVTWISVFWGGLHGLGVALGNTLFQVVVNQYFEKHRATASGFAFSGGCVGSFAFPVVLEYMLTHIGLAGTFLLTGGLILHVVPAGILMKEPPWIKRKSETACNNLIGDFSKKEKKSDCKNVTAKETQGNWEKSESIFAIAFKKIPSNHDINSKINSNEEDMNNHVSEKKNNTENLDKQLEPASSTTEKSLQVSSIYEGIIHMCCDPMFHMISLSLAAFVILFDLSLTVIVDYLKDKGLREDTGKYFISTISVGDFVGRLGFGWVTDRDFLSVPKYMMIMQLLQGLSFGAMPFFYSFHSLMVLVVVCGAAGGANVVMYPILVAKYLPTVQSLAIGCICFLGGIIAFGVPFMIGYFRDTFGSYDGLYFIIGGLSCVTGLLWSLEPLFLKLKTNTCCVQKNESTGDSSKVQKL